MNEQDVRTAMLDSFMSCPHREVQQLVALHQQMMADDPVFYGHLGVWAQDNTPIRDHRELFIAQMLVSELPEHRSAGYALFQSLPPYQANRVLDHIKGKVTNEKGRKVCEKRFGKNLSRVARSAVKTYLKYREARPELFDGAAIRAGKDMKSLYCRAQVKPNDRARAIVFEDGQIPTDSRYAQFKMLAKTSNPTEQALLIAQYKIPYAVVTGSLKEITLPVLAALIDSMSPQELLSNLGSLKKRGAMNNSDLKGLINKKLSEAATSKKVDVLKAQKAVEVVGLDNETAEKVTKVSDDQVANLKPIKRSTALFIDASGSMQSAIEIGKRLGALIASKIQDAAFYSYAFDVMPVEIACKSDKLSDWNEATKHIRASGGTACGAPIFDMLRKNREVEQIVIVTDEGENRAPFFVEELQKYKEKCGYYPFVQIVRLTTNERPKLCTQLEQAQIPHDVFEAKGADYYSAPMIVQLLARPSKLELLMEIMDVSLPTREEYDKQLIVTNIEK